MATRFWVFSDLHVETEGAMRLDAIAPDGFDAILVAGDVHTPGFRAIHWLGDRFGGCRLCYIPGNHDLWTTSEQQWTAEDMLDDMRDAAGRWGFDVLDRDSVDVDGVDVHGATLWTDLRLGYADRGQAVAAARKGMTDYRRIRRRPSGRHHYVRPEDILAWHRRDLAWLDGVLTEPGDLPRVRPAVVVTHHAPSPACLYDPYDNLGHCYASDLRPFVDRHRPDVWVHGHVHHRVDLRQGVTRVVGNGRGRGSEANDFDPALVVTVPEHAVDCTEEALRRG
jgi:hypothetical protein